MFTPHLISNGSIIFVAKGRTWTVSSDNPNFSILCKLVVTEGVDEDELVALTSSKQFLSTIGGDRIKFDNGNLILDGKIMPLVWYKALSEDMNLAHVLLIRVGDKVRIEGDEDAPDGIYVVNSLDDSDPAQRVYIETESGFFGFPKSSSIKETFHENL